jgi:hypothetical protein
MLVAIGYSAEQIAALATDGVISEG